MCLWCISLEVYSFLNFCFHIVIPVQSFINALSKCLVLGRGQFSSPGRTAHWGSDLKLYSGVPSGNSAPPKLKHLLGKWASAAKQQLLGIALCGDGSYWPGKLHFAGITNRIILFTLAGDFLVLWLQLRGSFRKKVKNHYYFVWKNEISLLFCMKKWNIITFSFWKVKNRYFFNWKVSNLYLFVK